MGLKMFKKITDKVNRKKKKEEIEIKEVELYVLIEEDKRGLREYLIDNGIEAAYVTSNTKDMVDKMFDVNTDKASRVLIVETGVGKFPKKVEREAIKELCEIGFDIENMKVSMLYRNKELIDVISKKNRDAARIARYENVRSIVDILEAEEYERFIRNGQREMSNDECVEEEVGEKLLDIQVKEMKKEFEVTKLEIEEPDYVELSSIIELVKGNGEGEDESIDGRKMKFRGIE